MRIKLAAIAKNEGPYFAAWIFHHARLGVTDFEIWVNNSEDDSLDVLQKIRDACGVRLTFKDANAEFAQCSDRGENFQVFAYRQIASSSKGLVDYLAFLDLDEFLTPRGLSGSLIDFLRNLEFPSAVGLNWCFDTAAESEDLFRLPSRFHNLLINHHVKTIFKIQDYADVDIHDVLLSSGDYVTANGVLFPPGTASHFGRAKVPDDLVPRGLPPMFVLHAAYRSKIEYLARLSRGRVDRRFGKLKTNRLGYIPEPNSYPRSHLIDSQVAQEYEDEYARFVSNIGPDALADEGPRQIYWQAGNAAQLISSCLDISSLEYLLRGLNFNELPFEIKQPMQLRFHFDSLSKSESSWVLSGWCFDWLHGGLLSYQVVSEQGQTVLRQALVRQSRPDVQKVHPGCPKDVGFRIEFEPELGKESFQLLVKSSNTEIDTVCIPIKVG